MTKQTEIDSLKQQLVEIQRKLWEMENNIHSESLIKSPKTDLRYYILDRDSHYEGVDIDFNLYEVPSEVHFADKEQCERYAEALTTFILLRKQPGTAPVTDGIEQYIILFGDGDLCIEKYSDLSVKINNMSPCFNSAPAAMDAVRALGKQKIIDMFYNFHS
jgi:hypothetical protein